MWILQYAIKVHILLELDLDKMVMLMCSKGILLLDILRTKHIQILIAKQINLILRLFQSKVFS